MFIINAITYRFQIIFQIKKLIVYLYKNWDAVAQLVDAMRCKPEGRGFIEIFQRHNSSGCFMSLGSTQTLTKISN
jgi:hypothetical protein